jgi:hypothetical protein
MDAREPQRVVSVCARPSSGPLVERRRVRVWAAACIPLLRPTHDDTTALTAEPSGSLSDWQLRAKADVGVNANRVAPAAPIQYP